MITMRSAARAATVAATVLAILESHPQTAHAAPLPACSISFMDRFGHEVRTLDTAANRADLTSKGRAFVEYATATTYSVDLGDDTDPRHAAIVRDAIGQLEDATGLVYRQVPAGIPAHLTIREVSATSTLLPPASAGYTQVSPEPGHPTVITVRPDVSDPNRFERVLLHELGHSVGLGHSTNPADVMYPNQPPNPLPFYSPGDLALLAQVVPDTSCPAVSS